MTWPITFSEPPPLSEDNMSASSNNTEPKFTTTESDECYSCGGEAKNEKCEHSKRECGHHCNHYVTDDLCDWCGCQPTEEE